MSKPAYLQVAQCYKQLNASVGRFGTSTLLADTAALKSGTGGDDSVFTSVEARLKGLLKARDRLATEMKDALHDAAFNNVAISRGAATSKTARCNAILDRADRLQ